MRRVPLSQAFEKTTLEVLYQGNPENYVLSSTVGACDNLYPGMVMMTDTDGTAVISDGSKALGLSAIYYTADIHDVAPTGNMGIWMAFGRYIVHSPAFCEDTRNEWVVGGKLYAVASGADKGKLEPGVGEGETRAAIAILLNYNVTNIEIELTPAASA